MAFVFLGIAAVVGGVGAYLVVRQARFIRRAECADGSLRGYTAVRTKTNEGTTAITTVATIEFTTADGRWGKLDRIVLLRRKKPGATVPIVYDPEDLERAQVAGSFSQWGPSAVVVGLAAIAAAVGIALLL